jgi:hypothetical protein
MLSAFSLKNKIVIMPGFFIGISEILYLSRSFITNPSLFEPGFDFVYGNSAPLTFFN